MPSSPLDHVLSRTHHHCRHRGVHRSACLRAVATSLVLALLAVGSAVTAPAASAHDALKRTFPADGASVAAPTSVAVTFSAAVLAVGGANRLLVTGPDGVVSGTPSVDGAVLRTTFDQPLRAGRYRVQWRAASEDGHPVSGTFSFTSTTSTTPTASLTSSATSPATSPAAGSASASPSAPAATVAADPARADDAGGPGRLLALGLLVLAALCAGTIVLAKRRARAQDAP